MFVTRNDPPQVDPGMVSLALSADGKLLQFVAVPTVMSPPPNIASEAGIDDWRNQLLAAAGIIPSVLEREMKSVAFADRLAPPPVFADTWEEWQSEHLVVDAASYNGQPVFFRIAPKTPDSTRGGLPALGIAFSITTFSDLFDCRRHGTTPVVGWKCRQTRSYADVRLHLGHVILLLVPAGPPRRWRPKKSS